MSTEERVLYAALTDCHLENVLPRYYRITDYATNVNVTFNLNIGVASEPEPPPPNLRMNKSWE